MSSVWRNFLHREIGLRNVSAIYRSACTAPRIFETQDEGQRQCMGLQYRKREHGKQCELRRLRR
jgi:hypothetical protein